ncbi:MAG: nucleotidyltransferase family protein [Candidatus Hydrogenedentes bacterium]|nr:nucleotidyltransferase family protein [Candidatus Hydrogenedentota bacterium]
MNKSAIELPLDEIITACRRNRITKLSLFGSALREDFNPESDIDLLVEFEPCAQVGLLALARATEELSEVLGREVDLVPKKGLKESLRDEILADAEVIFAA